MMVPVDENMKDSTKEVDPSDSKKNKSSKDAKYEAIRSLSDYYQTDKLPAARFLSALKKNEIGKLQEDDLRRCLEVLAEKDPDFSKTLDLLYRAVNVQSALTRQCVDFATQGCRQQLSAHYGIEIDIDRPAPAVFNEVLQGLKPALTGRKVDNYALNLLKAFGIWKSYSRNLDEIEATELLVNALIADRERRRGSISSTADILFRPATKMKAMTDILQVVKNGLTKITLAKKAESHERQEREKESRRSQTLQEKLAGAVEEIDKKTRKIGELEANLIRLEKDKASLEQRVEHNQAVSIHGKGELKGRSRVFLEKRLTPLLETALEFTELDPPRKGVILERLEMAKEEIRKEIEWLKSTD